MKKVLVLMAILALVSLLGCSPKETEPQYTLSPYSSYVAYYYGIHATRNTTSDSFRAEFESRIPKGISTEKYYDFVVDADLVASIYSTNGTLLAEIPTKDGFRLRLSMKGER